MPEGPAFANRTMTTRDCFDLVPVSAPAEAPDLVMLTVAEACR
jgi:hypothetical protein